MTAHTRLSRLFRSKRVSVFLKVARVLWSGPTSGLVPGLVAGLVLDRATRSSMSGRFSNERNIRANKCGLAAGGGGGGGGGFTS